MKYYNVILKWNDHIIVRLAMVTEVSVLKVLDKYLPLPMDATIEVFEMMEGN
ncbi:MAG: hypothetical protein J6S67_00410 [Methanobrevibacter sp.]|nr:hypothetical protein [Methanobrevibacter sp.]